MNSLIIICRIVSIVVLSMSVACNNGIEKNVHAIVDSTEAVHADTNRVSSQKLSRQSTVTARYNNDNYDLVIEGSFVYDDRRTKRIAARFSGRVEKLYVPYTLKYVATGSALMELYSPMINTLVSNYSFAIKSNDESIAEQARLGLQQLGLSNKQLLDISKNSESPHTLTIYSHESGFVIPSEDERLKEGMHVDEGQTLFMINDLKTLWGIGSVRMVGGVEIKKGMIAVIKSELRPDVPIQAQVDFIEPFYVQGEKFARIRLYVDNTKGQLLVNSNFTATVTVRNPRFLILPQSAVFDLGKRSIVWKKVGITKGGTGVFESREVNVTSIGKNAVAVINGLQDGDEVAAEPGLLIDSETFLR